VPGPQNERSSDEAMPCLESEHGEMIGRAVLTWGESFDDDERVPLGEAHPYRIASRTEMIREGLKEKTGQRSGPKRLPLP